MKHQALKGLHKKIKKHPLQKDAFNFEVESGFEPLYEVLQTSA